jgi:hypothetical protein
MADDTCKGWFAVTIESDRHLSASDVEDALYEELELREGFKATVVKVREETHNRLLATLPAHLEPLNDDIVIAVAGPDLGMVGTRPTLERRNEVKPVDGAVLSKADYPELYALILDKFGNTEGEETFRLPDLRGRVIKPNG